MSQRFKLDDKVKITPEFAEEAKKIIKAFEAIGDAIETLGDRSKKDAILKNLEKAFKDAIEIIQGDINARKKISVSRSHAIPEADYAEKEELEGAIYAKRQREKLEEGKAEVEAFKQEDDKFRASQAKKDLGGTGDSEFPSGHPSQYDKEDPREAPKNIAAGHDPHDSFDPHLPRAPASPEDIAAASKHPMLASTDEAKDERDLGEHNQARGGREALEKGKVEPQPARESARVPGEKKGEVSREGPALKGAANAGKPEAPHAAEYGKEHKAAAHKDATKGSSGK